MTKGSPDPSNFTGRSEEEMEESDGNSLYQSIAGIGAKIRDPIYSTLGIRDSNTGDINKRRRNLIGLGAGVLGGGTYATYKMMEDQFPTSNNVLDEDSCETVYGVDYEVAVDQNFIETRQEFFPNDEDQYILAPDSDGEWYITGFTEVEEGAYDYSSIPVREDKIDLLLENTGENKVYDWGEDVVEYCLEPGAWPK